MIPSYGAGAAAVLCPRFDTSFGGVPDGAGLRCGDMAAAGGVEENRWH